MPFKQWIWKDRENRLLLCLSAIAIIIQFIWLKWLYPFPNFMPPDSNAYVGAAYNNHTIDIWAIGYSKFLRLFSSFTSSHFVLVLFQYLLLQACVLYFLYTIRYLLAPGKWAFRLILACSVLNPLLLHISNFVSSDALFTTLSLLWFTQLLWILYRPHRQLLVLHALVLLLAFTVRYTALFYPFISIAVIVLTNLHIRVKLVGVGFIILLLGAFIGRTAYQYYTATGTVQYSAFGGWGMAANALYGYAYAPPDAPGKMPAKFRQLHTMVNHHMDSLRHLTQRPDNEVGVYYFWDFKSPLRAYMDTRWSKDSTASFFQRWAAMAPLYADYGRFLIKQHPGLFIKYYVWPNLVKYYVPPTKFMGLYNMGDSTVDPIVVTWFGWKSSKLPTYYKDKKIVITGGFPILLAIINLVFVLSFAAFVCLSGFSRCGSHSKRILWWTLVIWLSNMGFSVLSAPIELRYQLFPMVITFAFGILLMEFIIQDSRSVTKTTPQRDQAIQPEVV